MQGGKKKPRVKLKVEDWVLKMLLASMKNANDHGSCELISPPVHTLKKQTCLYRDFLIAINALLFTL